MKNKTFQNFKKYILHIVENKYKTVRKRKYSFDYYIKCFIKMLSDYNNWDIYKKLCFYKLTPTEDIYKKLCFYKLTPTEENLKSDNNKPYHWT